MKRILVPCDFSSPAINAYRFALDIATQSKGVVYLLNVIELPVLHDSVLMPVLSFEEQLIKELKEKAEKQFGKLTNKYQAENVTVHHAVEFGSPARMIIDYIKENNIDLVVMGSHGSNGFKEFLIGSNAEKIVRSAPAPVMVIKDYYKGPIKNIVFPNTLDIENQEELVTRVKALQHFFGAKLHLVWINTPLNFNSDTKTHQRLNAFVKRFMLKDYTINVFNHTDEEEGIIRFTKMIKGDLIAMGTNGRKGLAHVINGSLAEDVVNHTDNLIWTFSPQNALVEA
jgi:nucleotide-binding universal stress UspA family protein